MIQQHHAGARLHQGFHCGPVGRGGLTVGVGTVVGQTHARNPAHVVEQHGVVGADLLGLQDMPMCILKW